jgi:hypothetical protein
MSRHWCLFAAVLLAGLALAGTALAAPPERPASSRTAAAPTAAGFAFVFVSTANAYARAHGDPARIADPDCVEAARGRYMCSYRALRPGKSAGCHLMQARWTPELASSYTVTLAGRVKRCATLREALRSLG